MIDEMTAERNAEYDRCLGALNDAVKPNMESLPSKVVKDERMESINHDIWANRKYPVLYRYVPLNTYALSSILHEDVYMLPASKMNDVFEAAAYGINATSQKTQKANDKAQQELYLKAFSFEENNNLMWSHYADEHRGICIEYNFNYAPAEVTQHLYPVQYSNKRFTFQNPDSLKPHPFLLLQKSKDWKYEKEFRLIYQRDKQKDKLSEKDFVVKLNCITKIIFGLRTKQSDMDLVKSVLCAKRCLPCNNPNKEISLAKIQQVGNTFELEAQPIEGLSKCPYCANSTSAQ